MSRYADKMLGSRWSYSGDCDPFAYGGRWMRLIDGRRFHVIEFTNMDDACGSDNAGNPPYVVELREVDLNAIGPDTLASALSSCGEDTVENGKPVWNHDGSPIEDIALVEMCNGHGSYAPLESWTGSNAWHMIRQARAESNSLGRDAAAYEARMERPVNGIGSTAREYMTGDISSAIMRGVSQDDPKAILMLRLGMGGSSNA